MKRSSFIKTEAVGADPEEIPAENPGERKGAAGAEEGCGDSRGEY